LVQIVSSASISNTLNPCSSLMRETKLWLLFMSMG